MYQIETFELSTSRVAMFRLKAGCVIRVTDGRLWLTLPGCMDDIWLRAGESWTLPVNSTLYLSAEPAAMFQVAQPITVTRRKPGLPQPLTWAHRSLVTI